MEICAKPGRRKSNGGDVAAGNRGGKMKEIKPNKYGLYDRSIPFSENDTQEIGNAELEAQFDEGAFLMSHEDAVNFGFIHADYPYGSVILGITEDE